MTEALLLTYAAKRRAEQAPGVGPQTDMFFLFPSNDGRWIYEPVFRRTLDGLERINRELEATQLQLTKAAFEEIPGLLAWRPPEAETPAGGAA
jgi:hypothetical protein